MGVEVRSVFFVVMWLRFLPDYLAGQAAGEQTWRVNDEGDFTTQVTVRLGGAAPRHGGGVKGIAVLCDRAAPRGAVLFDAAWTNERGMAGALLKYTKRIVARPSDYEMPGWVSVDAAIGFLKGQAGDQPGLRGFIVSAVVAFSLPACPSLSFG